MVQKVSMHTVGPYSGIIAYLVKVVTLTTPTHVANIANEWLSIHTYYGDAYFAISLIRKCQSKFHHVKITRYSPFCMLI